MTNEEAKRQLESAYPYLSNEVKLALDKVIDALGDCYIIPKNSTWIIDGIDVQVALEKQIPKQVDVEESVNRYKEPIKRYWCPSCECEVDIDRDNWCSSCGQRLEWEL